MQEMNRFTINNRAKTNTLISDQIADSGYSENSGIINAFSNGAYLTATFQINAYANQLKITNLDQINYGSPPPERDENDIKEFSKHSRRRLFSLITSLDYEAYGKPIFVSATWHEDMPDNQQDIKTFLDKYHKRLKRNLPLFHLIWKLEYQKRGAPHFHFVLFPLDSSMDFNNIKINQSIYTAWRDLKKCKCAHCNIHMLSISPLNDFIHTMIYISKELGKITQNEQHHNLGRIWGSSRSMRIRIFKTVEMSFKDLSKMLQEVCNHNELNENLVTYIQAIRMFGFSSKVFIPYEMIRHLLLKYQLTLIQPTKKMKSITMSRYNFRKGKNL